MRVRYDFHLHSCLSPCGDDDMTPYNLVNMAKLLGYDMIALTDHNSCRNTPAAVRAGRDAGIAVVPGMELCTAEEAHVVCLFPSCEDALAFQGEVEKRKNFVKNQPQIFGRQLVMDHLDQVLGEEEGLLITAAEISVNDVLALARRFRGTAFPAHVDKNAYSVIAALGAIPPEAGFRAAEISPSGALHRLYQSNPELRGMLLLRNSDAHYLENMPEPSAWLDLPGPDPALAVAAIDGRLKAAGAWE